MRLLTWVPKGDSDVWKGPGSHGKAQNMELNKMPGAGPSDRKSEVRMRNTESTLADDFL